MKKILLTALVLLSSVLPALAGEIPKSQQNVYRFTANYCGPCHEMDPIFKRKKVKDEIAKYALFADIDVEKRPDFVEYYNVDKLPCVVITDAKGILLHKAYGKMTEEQLVNFLKERSDTALRGKPKEVLFGGTINLQPIVFGIGAFLWWLFG